MNIQIYNEKETMDKIYNNKCSICRYGDGEISHLFKTNPKYGSGGQNCSLEFRNKLINIFNNKNNKILLGFSGYFCDNNFIKENYKYILSKSTKHFIEKYKTKLQKDFPHIFNTTLYSAEITRLPQLKVDNKKYVINMFNKLFIENNCVFIGNDNVINLIQQKFLNLFKNIEFISGPSNNAYYSYNDIIKKLLNIENLKEKLILISLGPTATVMSYDLAQQGYWTIDIGHYFEFL